MTGTSKLRALYLSHLSKPSSDRSIYQGIRRHKIKRILELGFGTGHRATRMIEVAGLNDTVRRVRYTGIDLFEDRSALDPPGVSLKTAHRLLKATGAVTQLVPGNPLSALRRKANDLLDTDLVVVSVQPDPELMSQAWFYVPRVLHSTSLVYVEQSLPEGGVRLQQIERAQVESLAAGISRRRAA